VLDFTFNVTADPAKIDLILKEIRKMIVELEDLKTKVTELTSASDAATNLLTLLKEKIDQLVQNATDLETLKQELTAVGQQIEAEKQDLADAVVANTPAE
jgi:uncharacterized coiled-coil DUF342 family protein